jgi:competence ComEA-like helix-hairpin-helix protein
MVEQKLELNSATVEELTRLPGIGPALAERIVRYRETVHPFEEPLQITAVSGIGERTYSPIADRLTVAPPEEVSAPRVEAAAEELEGEEGAPGDSETEGTVIPPGESISPEEPDLEELASEERWPEAGEAAVEATEEGPSEAEEPPAEEEAVERPAPEAPPTERGLLPGSAPTPSERAAPSRSVWARLSWLWTAILGGFLGMLFALVVLAGINGSLDIAHSRAVLNIENQIDGLMADVDSLEGDVAGLRTRLDALEGLTARMDQVESAVDDLREEAADLSERTGALEEAVAAVSEELGVISDDVATLQEQAGRTRDFFIRLQSMLNDVFGEVGERSTTPTPEGK